MNTKAFVELVKKNFEVLPTKPEIKKFMLKNNIDLGKSTDSISAILVNAYQGRDYISCDKKEATKEAIAECIEAGMMNDEIAEHFGIQVWKLNKLKYNYGLTRKKTVLTDNDLIEYMKFHTQTEAASHFHVDKTEISRRVKRLGIKGKRNFAELWVKLKAVADERTLETMKKLEG